MIKHVGMEVTVRKEEVCCTHRSLETGTTWRGQSEAEGMDEAVYLRASNCGFHGTEQARQVSSPRIAYFNVFSRL